MEKRAAASGFTLIELSIVLVIIGLIVGGILTGRPLIRTAELNSVITDETRYITAVNTFRTKYNELPGDMLDATTYWGTDPNGCPDSCGSGCYTAPQTATCNGNGDGLIENDGAGGTKPQMWENCRAWQQLANAGLMPGAYTGTNGPREDSDNVPGLNVPANKLANSGFEWVTFNASSAMICTGWNSAAASTWSAEYNTQYLLLGGAGTGCDLVTPVLTPLDAYVIDAKVDDGNPTTGSVLAPNSWDTKSSCLTNPGVAPYNMSSSIPECMLLFEVKAW